MKYEASFGSRRGHWCGDEAGERDGERSTGRNGEEGTNKRVARVAHVLARAVGDDLQEIVNAGNGLHISSTHFELFGVMI